MATHPFHPLPTQVDLPALDHEVLARWEKQRIFERSLEQTAGGELWVSNEGPPTANGLPGVHHVEARAFKDLFPRFKTMQGYHVPRKAGWDCHGLPVEIAVERELGFSGKPDIERYGVAEFNARCRDSVLRHVDAWEQLTTRVGFWTDMADPYRTMDVSYVDSVWWSLTQIFDRGLLVKDFRVTPYCPRCGTGLSDHELGQPGVYQDIADPSITVRFPLLSGPVADSYGADTVDLLIWTTTPWTLVSNALVAVDPQLRYAVATPTAGRARPVLLAETLVPSLLGDGWRIDATFTGAELEHSAYRRPLDLFDVPNAHFVAVADFVTADEGTGLVHCSPSFGTDDFALCREYGVPLANPIDLQARFLPDIPLVGGAYFKEADPALLRELRERDALFREEQHEHAYPHCWRCHTALIYYALPSWYIKTTAMKDELLAENESTDWHPESIKHGRFGEWLRGNVDWALSRDRYWGTPLPVWVCANDHLTCVGSRAELGELAGRDLAGLDPHRPYVDEVTFPCATCGATAERVPQVIDAWYDSGSMPFAQWGYPYLPGSVAELARRYPANFICEAIDQTRGWFYSLMAVGTLVFDQSSYRTVLCLGHIVDADGRKMSKDLGNVLDPMALMERHGADGLRWLMLCVGNPWSTRRVGHGLIDDVVRRVMLTYWHTASFLVLYANATAQGPGGQAWTPELSALAPAYADRPLLDRWALSELYRTVDEVTDALETFDPVRAGRRLTEFVDDLSNWYVRRSRRRFWQGDTTAEGACAFATLHECVETLTRLLAPFVPFVTDQVWHALRADRATVVESVHLARWPNRRADLVDEALSDQMALVRRLVELGRSTRATSGVRTRQPLGRALVGAPGWSDLPQQLRDEVAAELNVTAVENLGDQAAELVEYQVKPNFRALGRRFAKRTPAVAAAITAADPGTLVTETRAGGTIVQVDGEPVQLTADDLVVTEAPRAGWAVATEHGCTVALDLALTPQLRRAGLVRESVRVVQEARRTAGFDVSDRIALVWRAADDELAQALREAADTVGDEVLAEQVSEHNGMQPSGQRFADHSLGLTCWLTLV